MDDSNNFLIKKNIKIKENFNQYFRQKRKKFQINFWSNCFILSSLFIIFFFEIIRKSYNKINYTTSFLSNSTSNFSKDEDKKEIKNEIKYIIPENENYQCINLDPIKLFEQRLNEKPEVLCKSEVINSSHICYKNNNNDFVAKNGIICKIENVIIDPTKWQENGYKYKGPVDPDTRGCPLISKGFFNMKCDIKNEIHGYAGMYKRYIESWNYELKSNENKEIGIEELAPGKTIFFLSRNQDSPNLYHGGSEFINAFSLMNILELEPENIQVIFLESMFFDIINDPLYNLYKFVISGGNEPIHIRNLKKKKYHITSAITVPINWDSPCFIYSTSSGCKSPSKTYFLLNKYIDKYMNISEFRDSFISDNEIFYYPNNMSKLNNYKKYVTIQWRKVWPKGRKKQGRILGNGPELADKLESKLSKDILIRLVDTARLSIEEQISIMKKTDYFVGVHGAGLTLSIFLPSKSIVHEILSNMEGLRFMSIMSGHKTYTDYLYAKTKIINDNKILFFNSDEFANKILIHMRENNF